MSGVFNQVVAGFLSVIFGIASFFSANLNFHKRTDDVLFTIAAVSDIHMKDSAVRRLVADFCFNDITKTIAPDLLLLDGDLVDEAKDEYYDALKSSLDGWCGVENVLLTLGNHDTWEDYDTSHEYESARDRWLEYSNQMMAFRHDEVFYHYVQSGYHFIVLGQESSSTAAEISDEQIAWMDAQLADASADSAGKPVFVFLHQPMSYTHGVGADDVDDDDEGFRTAAQSEKFQKTLDKYQNIIYVSGHTHKALNGGKLNGGDFATVEKVGENITSVNLPSMMYFGWSGLGGHVISGGGAVINVYEDKVEIRGRNFLTRTWCEDVHAVIDIK